MSDLDIYDDMLSENVISSDEYSEDDYDDDDLMNAAMSTQYASKAYDKPSTSNYSPRKDVNSQAQRKLNQITLLMRQKKIGCIYKKRSIKWLNNKQKRKLSRENLLDYLKSNKRSLKAGERKPKLPTISKKLKGKRLTLQTSYQLDRKNAVETIDLDDTDGELSPQKDVISALLTQTIPRRRLTVVEDGNRKELQPLELEGEKEVSIVELDEQKTMGQKAVPEAPENKLKSDIEQKEKLIDRKENTHKLMETETVELINEPADEKLQTKQRNEATVIEEKQPTPSLPTQLPSTTNATNKRNRSPSPITEKGQENHQNQNNNPEKKHQPEIPTTTHNSSTSLYREINALFAKHDEIVNKYINKSTNSTADTLEENMTRILLEIQTLSDILETKEVEWNRLLHLKNVKEETLTRLVRKKHILEMKDKGDIHGYALSELKELELYLSNSTANTSTFAAGNTLPTTVQQLVEHRANMRRADLEKERSNTNRLQSILVSSNILPRSEKSNNHFSANTKDYMAMPQKNAASIPSMTATAAKYLPPPPQSIQKSYQYLENSAKSSTNIGRQGPFKDVKSIIADFRQKNPEILPRVGKRIKMNDLHSTPIDDGRNLSRANFGSQTLDVMHNLSIEPTFDAVSVTANYTPTLEKLLSASAQRGNDSATSIHLKRSTPYSSSHNLKQQFNNSEVMTHPTTSYYRLQGLNNDELGNEISITPITSTSDNRYLQQKPSHNEYKTELLRSALHTNVQSNMYLDAPGEHRTKNFKGNADNSFNGAEVPFCQECKAHEARFVCAGCGNQWYCSRSCQISAWDKHSDSCNE